MTSMESNSENNRIQDIANIESAGVHDRIIQNFLKDKRNDDLYQCALQHPSQENMEALDKAFKEFYLQIRFTAYVAKNLYFHSINYDKKIKKNKEKMQLTLDQSITNGEEGTFKDFIPADNTDPFTHVLQNVSDVEDHMTHPELYETVKQLTTNEKEVLYHYYFNELRDTDIGKLLNKSQQTVYKTRKKALEKLRKAWKGGCINE
jgi:RNA polymerase sigma factor (sigma-70 family)